MGKKTLTDQLGLQLFSSFKNKEPDMSKLLSFNAKKSFLAFALSLAPFLSVQAQVSVAFSDNIIVLDDKSRSGAFELVNLGSDPTEFRLSINDKLVGTPNDASKIIRWSPARSLVSGNRTTAVRISARPTPQLAANEYIFELGVTAEVQPLPKTPKAGEEEAPADALAMKIPVVPTLPVTVYLRHQMEAPKIDAQPLQLTPNDKEMMGYFPVKKRNKDHSFVGQVEVIEKASGKKIISGRLHLKQGTESTKVNMPRGDVPLAAGAVYCLRIWDSFPATTEPYSVVCGN